jgi:hypothetical protein
MVFLLTVKLRFASLRVGLRQQGKMISIFDSRR